MKPSAQMMKKVTGDIRKLNCRLLPLAQDIDKKLRKHKFSTALPGKIVSSMFRKAVRTFHAIELLKRDGLIEESWILLRVLLETHVNILYFMRPPDGDIIAMTRRHRDAAILQKLIHLREVNFYETASLPSEIQARREEWEKLDQEIKARYSPEEFKAIKKHGFSGKSFQERAKDVGMKTMYELCYRIASRSVHSFDPAETSLLHGVYPKGKAYMRHSLLKSRRLQLARNQNMLLGRLAWVFANIIKDPILELELLILGVGHEKFCESPNSGDPVADEPDDDDDDPPGTYRVWRI